MVSILICHAPDDAAAADALGAGLARRGLKVFYSRDAARDPDWLSRLYGYGGVIVVWSASSLDSAELRDVAGRAVRINRLIAAVAGDLAADRVPAEFRARGVASASDIEGIIGLISRLPLAPVLPSAPRRVGAADVPEVGAAERRSDRFGKGLDIGSGYRSGTRQDQRPPGVGAAHGARSRVATAPAPQEQALAVEAGRLVHKIPGRMWVGVPETVEVRLGRAAVEGLAEGLVGRGALSSHEIPILETMSVSLLARGGAFEIERQSEATQLVSGSPELKGTAFEQADYGRWSWLVTPRKTGAHMLFLRVSASLKDSRGLPSSASLPDREFPVSVSVHAGRTSIQLLRRGILGVGGAVGAGLLGAVTQDLWWPKLKSLLQAWGLLG